MSLDASLDRVGLRTAAARDVALAIALAVLTLALLLPLTGTFAARLGVVVSLPERVLLVGLTVAQTLVLAVRRSHPRPCLLLVALLQVAIAGLAPEGTTFRGVAPLVAFYSAGTRLALSSLVGVGTAALLMELVGSPLAAAVLRPVVVGWTRTTAPALSGPAPTPATVVVSAVLVVALYGGAAAVGVAVAARRESLALLEARTRAAEQDRAVVARRAAEAERLRMARELHDVAAHHLSGLLVQASAAERLVGRDVDAARGAMRGVRQQGKQALDNLRSVVGMLRQDDPSSELDPIPGVGTLPDLVASSTALGEDVELVVTGRPYDLAPLADVTAYRVTQQALSNARQHAPGAPVRITLTYEAAGVRLVVDSGLTSPVGKAAERPGFGLAGMRERAAPGGAPRGGGRRGRGPRGRPDAGGWSGRERHLAGRSVHPLGTERRRVVRLVIRVVLADDQAVVRAGFTVILESYGDIAVVGEASTGPEAVAVCARTAPDVVCMDVRMPGGDGLAATRQITTAEPHAPAVLVVTTFDLDEYVFGALEAGASGFLLKDAEPDTLADAVRRLADGSGLLDQSVTRRVMTEFARRRPRPAATPAVELLTPREADIVRVLARGLSNDEIADELFIETSTVKSHLTRAMGKIGTRDRLQTVVWAYRNGLVAD